MGLLEATRRCLSKFATFSGRASRAEYWWFLLAVLLASVVLSLLDSALFGPAEGSGRPLTGLFQLAMFVPLLAAAWRRLHDTGRPGWYALLPMLFSLAFVGLTLFGIIALSLVVEGGAPAGDDARGVLSVIGLTGLTIMAVIQLVLTLLMLWWLTRPSEVGPNAYGPSPAQS